MYEPTRMISVSTTLPGRVINSQGEPIDGKGAPANTTLLSLVHLVPANGKKSEANMLFETGIKVIDLLAPLAQGGVSCIFAGAGVGQQVIVEEIMQHITSRYNKSVLICLSMNESSYETSGLMDVIREGGLESHTITVFEQTANIPAIIQRLVQVGLTIAAYFQAQGYTTLLVADRQVTIHSALAGIDALKNVAAKHAITAILLGSDDDYTQYRQDGTLRKLDEFLFCNRELFKRQIYPAIDPLQSGSHLLDEGVVSPEHRHVAQETQELLRRYYALRQEVETHGDKSLSVEDQQIFRRGQRIEQFLTQPFVVAEPYTDIPGEYVTLNETIESFEALLSGQYDDVPEKSLWMKGRLK